MKKNILLSSLIESIKKALLPTLHDPTLCQQYAVWLIQETTQKSELKLISDQEILWTDTHQKKLNDYLKALINEHMPLAYILGTMPFADLEIICKPPVLIPRPETEEWCLSIIDRLKAQNQSLLILDLCTGSGCIALALAKSLTKAKVIGVDISDTALALARQNAIHNKASNVTFLHSDLFNEIPKKFTFDLIVGNPPYIRQQDWTTLDKSVTQWEDKNALIAEDDGLALLKRIINDAPEYIKKNLALEELKISQLFLEIDHTQGDSVAEYMKQRGYNQIKILKDLEGKDRVACGRVDNVAITQNSREKNMPHSK